MLLFSAAEALYRQAPTNYLSHLLGHEGSGSAFALLKVGAQTSNSKLLCMLAMA
jgi:secreted Zn-dependent insulinase-like peptidase